MIVFLDTNILLHCVPVDQINWSELIKKDEVTLVFPLVVLNEIDKHKRNPKYKKRCAALIKLLQNASKTGKIKDSIMVRFLHAKPKDVVFDTHGLIRSENDDVFLAEIINFQQQNEDKEAVLITADSSFQLRCSFYGITVIEMPEKYELVEEDDQALEIKKLKAENHSLRNTIPKLDIFFQNEAEVLEVRIEKPDFDEYRRAVLQSLRVEFPKESADSLEFIRRTHPDTSVLDINVHNDNLERFYEAYDVYLAQRRQEYIDTCLAVPLNITIENQGNSPAKNICIELFFPEGLKVIESLERDYEIDEPIPPRFEYGYTKFRDNFAPRKYNYPIAQTVAFKGKGDVVISKKDDKYIASVELESLQHNKTFTLDHVSTPYKLDRISVLVV